MNASGGSLTREQLYDLIWKDPTRTVARSLGLSDVGLAKICRKLHIPRPWREYWREKETGRRPREPKLPAWPTHLAKEPESITFRHVRPRDEPSPPRPPEPESVQQQRVYEAIPDHKIVECRVNPVLACTPFGFVGSGHGLEEVRRFGDRRRHPARSWLCQVRRVNRRRPPVSYPRD